MSDPSPAAGAPAKGSFLSRLGLQLSTFDALKNEYFRYYWWGRLCSSAAIHMLTVGQGWLVYELTGSALALSWVTSARNIIMFFLSFYGGVISDRVPKRHVIVVTRIGSALSAAAIALIITLGQIQIWHLVVLSIVSGLLGSFMTPAEQSIVAELVERKTLLNAVSLNAIGMGITGLVSSALAGVIVDTVGVQGVFWIMAGLYGLAVLFHGHLPVVWPKRAAARSVLGDLLDGARYIRGERALLGLLAICLGRVLFAQPYITLLPKFAADTLNLGATGLGLLMGAPSIGAIISSFSLASLKGFRRKGLALLASAVAAGALLLVALHITWLPALILMLALVGVGTNTCMVCNNTLLQGNSDPRYQGRVMAVYMMMWGLTFLGTIPAGWLADRIGVAPTVTLQGLGLCLTAVAVALWQPTLKKLE